MQASRPASGAAPALEGASWLMLRLSRLAIAVAEELSSFTAASLQIFWQPIVLTATASQVLEPTRDHGVG